MAKRFVPALCDQMEVHLFHSLKKYRRFMRRHGVDSTPRYPDECDAFTSVITRKGGFIAIVVDYFEGSTSQRHALYAHEATHVVQRFLSFIGEDSPGDEEEAYLVQGVTLTLIEMGEGHDD